MPKHKTNIESGVIIENHPLFGFVKAELELVLMLYPCKCRGPTKTRTILRNIGADVTKTLAYYRARQGWCDCTLHHEMYKLDRNNNA